MKTSEQAVARSSDMVDSGKPFSSIFLVAEWPSRSLLSVNQNKTDLAFFCFCPCVDIASASNCEIRIKKWRGCVILAAGFD